MSLSLLVGTTVKLELSNKNYLQLFCIFLKFMVKLWKIHIIHLEKTDMGLTQVILTRLVCPAMIFTINMPVSKWRHYVRDLRFIYS